MSINLIRINEYKVKNNQRHIRVMLCWLRVLITSILLLISSYFACANSLRDPTIPSLRDPTMPLNLTPKSESQISLQLAAISGVEGRYFAIINGQRVYEGSIINGAKIETIRDKSVVYSYKGKSHTLNMRLSLIH